MSKRRTKSILDYSNKDYNLRATGMEKSLFSEGYKVFLRELRAARKQAGFTQIELARRLRETQSFVSKCERGERRLDIIEARAFCRAMGIAFEDFARTLEQKLK